FCSFYLTPLRYAWIGEMIKEKKVKDSFSAFILGSLYGVSDEIHQHFVPRRSSDVLDLVADFLGVLIGIGIMLLLLRIYSHLITSKAKEVKQ
ncbi:MAG: VanZ family protein, partial [Thermoplasmata archaeon]|nr:VanZ family protein [Thermoplasmata archaeon]